MPTAAAWRASCATCAAVRWSPRGARLHALIDELEPTAQRLGCAAELESARRLVERNGAMAMRAAGDPRRATAWLAERFLDGLTGR